MPRQAGRKSKDDKLLMMTPMVVCKQCGVELESGMQICPLCDTPVLEGHRRADKLVSMGLSNQKVKPKLLKHILWQIACVLLLSGILATLIINISIIGHVTWSIYPVTICLIILSYTSLVALWNTKLVAQLLTGWIASSAVLFCVQLYTSEDWPLQVALPIVSAVNMVSMLLILVLSNIKVKGLNILAVVFAGIAVICLIIEGILSLYFQNKMQFRWSVVVSACLLPVMAAIVFMYLRTRNNNELQKIFHT